ncbi:MAG: hypothetical protein ABSG43_08505 [Solirubrobacteraceae bacterium]
MRSSRFLNKLTARSVALAACAVIVGSFAMATPAMANVVPGVACIPSDGKISGRGSNAQQNAFTGTANGSLFNEGFIGAYTDDFCGVVAPQYAGDPASYTSPTGTVTAGGAMVVDNYPSATTAGARGSGEGLAAVACRTDAFGGTEIP